MLAVGVAKLEGWRDSLPSSACVPVRSQKSLKGLLFRPLVLEEGIKSGQQYRKSYEPRIADRGVFE